ncbi:helix-turn-helix transcriptional regulator [Pseudomonas fragi]|uniref:helix-turn-helix transcriptional regulator n=1 Tax=Pseudomonas fragi TaxID=296 RepID=UPI001F326513|nr:helix-turn-helix transcriptional regulator [Pseudomonas fragi]MCF6762453.1 helix-turn-helix transcriptional regulator [Pseudomonas fragi]MCK6254176.1 helix-turn-helix transcriptional regulator [Pseudomonas fragi]
MDNSGLSVQTLADMGLNLTEYDSLIGEFYDGSLDPKLMARTLRHVRSLYQANYVILILRVPDQPDLGLMIVVGDIEREGEVSYWAYPQALTPFNNPPMDQVFTVDDLMSEEQWTRSAYFKTYGTVHDTYHIMGADISTPDGGKLRFRITRPKSAPAFSACERTLCGMFIPHLRRAMHVHNLIDRSESMNELYSQAISRLSVATIVLDQQGKVLSLNPMASELLEQADGLKLVGGHLEATYPSDNRELQRLVRNAFAGDGNNVQQGTVAEAMSVSRPSGQINLGVVVEAIATRDWAEGKGAPGVVVYIRDAVGRSLASETLTKQLFNLTRAETALAMELANGLSLEEAAEALNVRRNTARAHLRSIFSKTGVRRQTELVRIILNSVVALGKPGLAIVPGARASRKKTGLTQNSA